jgi:small ligand-binding sensory domain FIST
LAVSAFLVGHATHPDWRGALALAAAQVEAQRATQGADNVDAAAPSLGLVYFTDHYAAHAQPLLDELRQRWPGVAWVGSAGVGVAAGAAEYFDEPALVLMLAALPARDFEVFSGAHKLQRIAPFSALVHADPSEADLNELIVELSQRLESGYLFGGLVASRGVSVHLANGVWRGGLSGVAFSGGVPLISRVTQGCQPLGATRRVTACERHVVLELDGRPALDCLLADLGVVEGANPREVLPRLRATLAGITGAGVSAVTRPGQFGTDTRVRHLIGLDPARRGVAVAEVLEPGMQLAFCQRDMQAARRDLVRICAEIRDEVESGAGAGLATTQVMGGDGPAEPAQRILGAVYVSCSGRGGPHFGGPSAELKIVQHALGGGAEEVPLVGFFAAGEIARHHVYGYTGVLTVFTGSGRG